jgi:hypothetical protein
LKSFGSDTAIKYVLGVSWTDRWQVYQRLRELDIPCNCEANQPLEVEIPNPTIAMQIWSVTRQFTASRQELIATLEGCWYSRHRNS